jgi:hypothetical protein
LFGCIKDKYITPDIKFITGKGYTSIDATFIIGSVITVGTTSTRGPDGSYLTEYKIERIFNGSVITEWDTIMIADFYSKTANIYTSTVPGVEKFKFKIIDYDENFAEIELNVTTVLPDSSKKITKIE